MGIQKSDNIKIFEEHGAQNDMLEMTGNVAVNKRRRLFKRLFFLTPQVHFLLAKIFLTAFVKNKT